MQFLAIGWPLGTLSNALLQLVCLALAAQHNQAVCDAPFMRALSAKEIKGVQGTLMQRHAQHFGSLPLPTEKQVCLWHTLSLQLLLGYTAPILYQTRADVRAALAHAERRGIPANDRLYCTFRSLDRYVASATPLLAILGSACVAVGTSSALLLARGGK
ncbi:glycosyl transferase [Chlorella sorokiniana]|uniref:Glycosyl transferase n=1 Tax=Chlorella sorokiniana TaxID=3076 RepID=A0A2P6TZK7_CHLSO|nr:glycosyl transferase [Chlorella sorokiniana]|eukprot:PRW59502.1 glycosyl transferase [Chlorella sorokiniana]